MKLINSLLALTAVLASASATTLTIVYGKETLQKMADLLANAAMQCNVDTIARLIYRFEDQLTSPEYYDGYMPVCLAVAADKPVNEVKAAIRALMAGRFDVNAEVCDRETALNTAIYLSANQGVRALIDLRVNINGVEPQKSPVLAAVKAGNAEALRMLLDAGANVDIEDPNGDNPLILAVKSLFDASVTVDWDTKMDMVQMLLLPELINKPNIENGRTALHFAVAMSSMEGNDVLIEYLLEARVDVHARDEMGLTPLLLMADAYPVPENDRISSLHSLIYYGAKINEVDDRGNTALHRAVRYAKYSPSFIKHLLDAGADVMAVNNDGQTAMDIIKLTRMDTKSIPIIEQVMGTLKMAEFQRRQQE